MSLLRSFFSRSQVQQDGAFLLEKTSHYNDWPNAQGYNVDYEERSPVDLAVIGNIPSYAAGVLFRTGLGVRNIKTDKGTTYSNNHWFDNFSQIHRFQLHQPDSGNLVVKITYNSRSTSDGLKAKIKKTGRLDGFTFGAKYDPCTSYFQKLQSVFHPAPSRIADEVSIAVTLSVNFPGLSRTGERHEDSHDRTRVVTLCNKTDATPFQMLDPQTLEPIGLANQRTLHPQLKGPSSATHAKSDPITGDIFNYNLDFGRIGIYRVFTVSAATGKTSVLATITTDAAYIHSLFLTEHYVVLCVWNSFYTAGGATMLLHQNIVDALANYDDSRPARWYVVDRTPVEVGGKGLIAKYESDPFFCFHTVNAYEEPSLTKDGEVDIVADLLAYENLDCIKRFYVDNLLSNSPAARAYSDPSNSTCRASLRRFRLPTVPAESTSVGSYCKAKSECSRAKELSPELPTINSSYVTRKHRYVYGMTDTGKSTFIDGIVKYDTLTHTTQQWSLHGHTPGEPIFVADPSLPDDEDGGVLLSVVLDGVKGKSYLLCLDARTMQEVGRAMIGGVVGFGFHGAFFGEGGKSPQQPSF